MICSFHIYYKIQDDNVKISFSEKKSEYATWKHLKTFSYAHIITNPIIQLENIHGIVLTSDLIPELDKQTGLKWQLVNNEYQTLSSLEIWNVLKSKMNKDTHSPLNIENILFNAIIKLTSLINNEYLIPLTPIINYTTLGYIKSLYIVTYADGKLNIYVNFVEAEASVALFPLIISEQSNNIKTTNNYVCNVNSKLINDIIFNNIYNIDYLDYNAFEQVLKTVLTETGCLAFSLYAIITLSNKLFSTSLFDNRSSTKITPNTILYQEIEYYRMFHVYEKKDLKLDITPNFTDSTTIIPISSNLYLKCWNPNRNDMIAKLYVAACGVDNYYNKFKEPILEYTESSLSSLSNDKPNDEFQIKYYQWLLEHKQWKVYNECYNDIDIMKNPIEDELNIADYYKEFITKLSDDEFIRNIQRFIRFIIFESIKLSPDHIISMECKNYTGCQNFDVHRFKRALSQKYFPGCQLHLIVNCQTSNNINQLEKDLIEYIKEFNVNVKIVIKFIDNYKYDVSLKYITIKPN